MELAPIYAIQGSPDVAQATEDAMYCSPTTETFQNFDLPQPENPPSTTDWDAFQPLIEELYLRRRWTLHVVEEELGNRYGFYASDKMYKDRLARWGIKINYNEEDYMEILDAVAKQPEDLTSITMHGRPVEWTRVRRRLSSGGKALCSATEKQWLLGLIKQAEKQTSSSTTDSSPKKVDKALPCMSIDKSAQVTMHYQDRDLEYLLTNLHDYIQDYFLSTNGADYFWRPETRRPAYAGPSMYGRPFSSIIHPAELNQHYSRGLKLIATKHIIAGFGLLHRACSVIQDVLLQQHPALISSLLATFAGHDTLGSSSAQNSVAGMAYNMSSKLLGLLHPITRLCRYLQQYRETDRVIDFWRRYSGMFSSHLGRNHRISIYMSHKILEKLLDAHQYQEAQTHMEQSLSPVFEPLYVFNEPAQGVSPACLCYIRRKARLFRCLGRFEDAIKLHFNIVELLHRSIKNPMLAIRGNPIYEEAFRTAEEVAVLYKRADASVEAIEVHAFALEVCVLVRGTVDGKTSTLVSSHEKRLTDHLRYGEALVLRRRFPHVFIGEDDVAPSNSRTEIKYCVPSVSEVYSCPHCSNVHESQNNCPDHRVEHIETEDEMEMAMHILCQLSRMVAYLRQLDFGNAHHAW